MGKRVDLLGKRFGRLLVVRETDQRLNNSIVWETLCDCGKSHKVRSATLVQGKSQSCGCLISDTARERHTTHGLSKTGTYRSWQTMWQRCTNPKEEAYPDYGGRGITVCDRWKIFENFLEDMGERPYNHTLDRNDVNGNYEPANCSWKTPMEQANNMRINVLLTFNGESLTLRQWSQKLGLDYGIIRSKYYSGKPIEEILKAKK